MTAMNIALDASGSKEADQRAITDKQMSVAHPTNFKHYPPKELPQMGKKETRLILKLYYTDSTQVFLAVWG